MKQKEETYHKSYLETQITSPNMQVTKKIIASAISKQINHIKVIANLIRNETNRV